MRAGRRALSCGVACACLLVIGGAARRARAEGSAADSDRANLLFKKGKVAFNGGNFNDALRIYTEAWSLKKSPDIAGNLAQTESQLGMHRAAAEHFAFALGHLLPSTTDEQKAALAEGLELEKKQIGSLHVTLEPADASLTIDGVAVPIPPNGDVFVDPGEHRTAATRDGYEAKEQTVRVSKGAAQVLWVKLQPVGAPAEPRTAEPRTPERDSTSSFKADSAPHSLGDSHERSLVPVLVGGGVVAVGAAVGVVFLLSGNASQGDADRQRAALSGFGNNACGAGTPNAPACSALYAKNSDIDRARTIEVAGFAVAGAAAIGTALYWFWPQSSTAMAGHWSPTFAIARDASSVGLSGRF